jgi:hypothetical protein
MKSYSTRDASNLQSETSTESPTHQNVVREFLEPALYFPSIYKVTFDALVSISPTRGLVIVDVVGVTVTGRKQDITGNRINAFIYRWHALQNHKLL